MDRLAGLEDRFLDWGAVDVGAVGRAEVPNHRVPLVQHDLAVGTRHRRIINLEIVGKTAPKEIDPRLELDFPSPGRTGFHDQPWHNW